MTTIEFEPIQNKNYIVSQFNILRINFQLVKFNFSLKKNRKVY